MNDDTLLTAEDFAARRHDLPDGGRWVELVAGRVVALQPPDVLHGNVVLNFCKRLADCVQSAQNPGYACFDLGLLVGRNPDTVRVPQVSYYRRGQMFEQVDAVVSEAPPSIVVEVASTNDRRRNLGVRIEEYLRWGVERVWIVDPVDRQCLIHVAGRPVEQLKAEDTLIGGAILPEFHMQVADLFVDPKWWNG